MAENEAEKPAETEAEQPAAPAAEAAPGLPDASALLSMFSSTEMVETDLSTLVEIAGDVEMDDLLEQLHIVAAALGIDATNIDEFAAVAEPESEELLAA